MYVCLLNLRIDIVSSGTMILLDIVGARIISRFLVHQHSHLVDQKYFEEAVVILD